MRTDVLPPLDPAFCTPVPGTDLYLHASFDRYQIELTPLDAAGEYAGPVVRVQVPDGSAWGAAEGWEYSGGPSSSDVGYLSPSSGFDQHPDGHRALAFAADLGADLLDALREGAEETRRARRAEVRAEELARKAEWAKSDRISARVGAILRGLLDGRDGDLSVRLSLPRDDGFVTDSGVLAGVDEKAVFLTVRKTETVRYSLSQILRVELKDGGRYALAFTRDQVALNEDPDSYSASVLGLDPDLPAPGARVRVTRAGAVPDSDGIVAWQVNPLVSAEERRLGDYGDRYVAVLLPGEPDPLVLGTDGLEPAEGEA